MGILLRPPRPSAHLDKRGLAEDDSRMALTPAVVTDHYVRRLMPLLALFLLVVTVVTSLLRHEFATSISAYHSGAVRDVFVGTLIAIATCLVAYQGRSPLEDFALNAAGFYVVFVALIPTELQEILREVKAPNTTLVDLQNEFVTYLQVAVTFVLISCAWLLVAEWRSGEIRHLWTSGAGPKALIVGSTVLLPLFLGLCVKQLWLTGSNPVVLDGIKIGPKQVPIHFIAAILFIASLAVAVASRAWPGQVKQWAETPPDPNQGVYRVIFVLMTLGAGAVAVAVMISSWHDHVILIVEWWEVALFTAFWVWEYQSAQELPAADEFLGL